MVIKETKHKTCKRCGSRSVVSREEYGCDYCQNPINYGSDNKEEGYLDITVFYQHDALTQNLHFCSWICCLRFLRNIQQSKYASNYFCNLPYLNFETSGDGLSYTDFFAAIKTIAEEDKSGVIANVKQQSRYVNPKRAHSKDAS